MVYAITYDLNRSGQDYSSLFNKIQSLGVAHKPLQNLWFLDSRYSADQIRDELRLTMDQNDFVFVVRLQHGNYSGFLKNSSIEWLEGRI